MANFVTTSNSSKFLHDSKHIFCTIWGLPVLTFEDTKFSIQNDLYVWKADGQNRDHFLYTGSDAVQSESKSALKSSEESRIFAL